MNNYVIGNRINCKVVFEDEDGDPLDPTTVGFKVINPNLIQTNYTFGIDLEIVKDSVGNYRISVDGDIYGIWKYRWFATGDGKSADEKYFAVMDSEFA